jgi:hypothetical protein
LDTPAPVFSCMGNIPTNGTGTFEHATWALEALMWRSFLID